MKRVEVLHLRPVPQGLLADQAHMDPPDQDSTGLPVILAQVLTVILDQVHNHMVLLDQVHMVLLDQVHMVLLDQVRMVLQDPANMDPKALANMDLQVQAHMAPLDLILILVLMDLLDLPAQVVHPLKDILATQAPILPMGVHTPVVLLLLDPGARPKDQVVLQIVVDNTQVQDIVDLRQTEQWGTLDPQGGPLQDLLVVLSQVRLDPLDQEELCVLRDPTAPRQPTFRNSRTPSMLWRSEA